MRPTPRLFGLLVLACCSLACSDDTDNTSVGEGSTSESPTTTATDTDASADSDPTTSDPTTTTETGDPTTTSETGGDPIPCGELKCVGGEVCLTFPQDANCTNLEEGESCPEGTQETQCGGAGLPCCCEPTPPALRECVLPEGCGDPVDCACLAELCVPECGMTGTPGVFICEEPQPP